MSNIKIFPSDKPILPVVILDKAKEWELDEVLIIGWDKNEKCVLGGSHPKLQDMSWLLENAKRWVMDQMEEDQ